MGDADGPEVRHALLRALGLRPYETHTGGGACGWLAVGGAIRALTPEEIQHDPWDAADGGAVRFWIMEKKQSVVNYTAHNQHVFRNNPLLFPEGHFSHNANARQLDQGAMMGTAQLRGLAGVLDVDIVVITEHDHPRLHLHCADGGNDVSFVSRERVVAAFTGAELRARRMVAIFFDERQHHFSALLQEMNTRTRMLHSSPSSLELPVDDSTTNTASSEDAVIQRLAGAETPDEIRAALVRAIGKFTLTPPPKVATAVRAAQERLAARSHASRATARQLAGVASAAQDKRRNILRSLR